MKHRLQLLGPLLAADAAVLALARPHFPALAQHLATPHAWLAHAGADAALAELAGAAAWLVAAWLGLAVLVIVAASVPGTVGRLAAALSELLVPAVLRRLIAGSAGLGVLFAPAAASALPSGASTGGTSAPLATVAATTLPPGAHPQSTPVPAPVWPGIGSLPSDRRSAAAAPGSAVPSPMWPVDGASSLPRRTQDDPRAGSGIVRRDAVPGLHRHAGGPGVPVGHPPVGGRVAPGDQRQVPASAAPGPGRGVGGPAAPGGGPHVGGPNAAGVGPHVGGPNAAGVRPHLGAPGAPGTGRREGAGPQAHDGGAPPPISTPVRVRPGDSLWLIAARRLGPHATAAQIAAGWPRWYAANRAAIGADPDLIRPGQRLTPPVTGTHTREHRR